MATMKLAKLRSKSGATVELSLDDAIIVIVMCSDLVLAQHSGRMPLRRRLHLNEHGNKEV